LSDQPTAASQVIWEGHPWMGPALIALTVEAVTLGIVLSWVEFVAKVALFRIGSFPLLAVTFGSIFLLWLLGAVRLALVRASSHYTLRGSSLEIQHGVLSRKIYTVSAAGFSDLEVIKSLMGRILNTGSIIIETDSDRDLKLNRVRDPIKVATLTRQVMTVPMVRVAGQSPVPAKDEKVK
jgi:uncharacterized membrane protein YdbT with pleckstrin-like domain